MRFGGHETFHIREGWLHKGLQLLVEAPPRLVADDAADHLGVGRNMAKSIRHWLLATGLAESHRAAAAKLSYLRLTDFGKLVWREDPYFADPGTWWALHINLTHSPDHAYSWNWFFNHFDADAFDRPQSVGGLRRYLQRGNERMPTEKTLDRDMSCLLASYARPVPYEQRDPEEAYECPLLDLELMTHYATSGRYQLNRAVKSVPNRLLLYALERAFPEEAEVRFLEAAGFPNSPGRVFVLNHEALFDLCRTAEDELPRKLFRLEGLAGERILKRGRREPLEWLHDHYADAEARIDAA